MPKRSIFVLATTHMFYFFQTYGVCKLTKRIIVMNRKTRLPAALLAAAVALIAAGFPLLSVKYGSIFCKTRGSTGVVAAWSKYILPSISLMSLPLRRFRRSPSDAAKKFPATLIKRPAPVITVNYHYKYKLICSFCQSTFPVRKKYFFVHSVPAPLIRDFLKNFSKNFSKPS